MSPHLKAEPAHRTDPLEPRWWTWCGEIVGTEDVRDEWIVVECFACLELYEDE